MTIFVWRGEIFFCDFIGDADVAPKIKVSYLFTVEYVFMHVLSRNYKYVCKYAEVINS